MQTLAIVVLCLITAVTGFASRRSTGAEPVNWTREPTTEELVLLEQAKEILIGRCMRRQGIPYWVISQSEPEALRKLRGFNYVIDDVAWAREYGFGRELQRRLTRARDNDPNQRYFQTLSPQRQTAAAAALMGARPEGLSARLPTGGIMTASDRSCIAQAEDQLYGDLRAWFRFDAISANLRPLYVPQVRADPRYRQALADWARCLRRRGLPYANPDQLRAAVPERTAGLGPADAWTAEVLMAVVEATCARSTPLAATARELDRHYSSIVRAQYRLEVEGKRKLQLVALPRARQIIEAGL